MSVLLLSTASVSQPWELVKLIPDMRGAELTAEDLSHIHLDGCAGIGLEGARLDRADLRGAHLVHCNLNMRNASLRGARLQGANLDNIDLSGGNLAGANLNGARLYMVDFRDTDLRTASMGVQWTGRVNMRKADLRGADFSNASHLDGVYFWEGAIYDTTTRWPSNFDPEDHCRFGRPGAAIGLPNGAFKFSGCF